MAKKQKQERTFREILEIKSDLNALDSSYYITSNLIRDFRIKRKSQPLSVGDVITKTYCHDGDKYMVEFFMIKSDQISMPREYFRIVVFPEKGHTYFLDNTPLNTEDVFNLYRAHQGDMTYLYIAIKEEQSKLRKKELK